MSYPSFDKFAELTGSEFAVAHGALRTRLMLKKVSSHAPSSTASGQPVSSFSLLFEGDNEPVLAQQIYLLEHADAGAFDLFIVPLGPDRAGGQMLYEAVFN